MNIKINCNTMIFLDNKKELYINEENKEYFIHNEYNVLIYFIDNKSLAINIALMYPMLINKVDNNNKTSLYYYKYDLNDLLNLCPNKELTLINNYSLLLYKCKQKNIPHILALIKYGFDINVINKNGNILHNLLLIKEINYNIVINALLQLGIETFTENNDGQIAADIYRENKYYNDEIYIKLNKLKSNTKSSNKIN